jgi:hypothetical protein
MAWSWSHSAEGLSIARDNLAKKPKEELEIIFAEWRANQRKHGIQDGELHDYSEAGQARWHKKYNRALEHAKKLPDDVLVDFIWERAEEYSTCSNGGFELYMCPGGCMAHCVTCDETDDDGEIIDSQEDES